MNGGKTTLRLMGIVFAVSGAFYLTSSIVENGYPPLLIREKGSLVFENEFLIAPTIFSIELEGPRLPQALLGRRVFINIANAARWGRDFRLPPVRKYCGSLRGIPLSRISQKRRRTD